MAARIEVIVNGERVCTSGINGDGVLDTMVTYAKRPGEEAEYELTVGGLGRFHPSGQGDQHVSWTRRAVRVNDEITIRILSPGEFDPPLGLTPHPIATIDDPLFGRLDYNIDAWDGDLDFKCHPFSSAHVHLWATEDGPSESQRHRFREFVSRHSELWPVIAESLVRCHTEIDSLDELNERIKPRLCINMRDDDDEIELSYSVAGDPEYRAYFVTLRHWQVAEVCSAD